MIREVQQNMLSHDTAVAIDNPQTRENVRRSVRIAVSALDELRQVLSKARSVLPSLMLPTLVMHGRDDTADDAAFRQCAKGTGLVGCDLDGAVDNQPPSPADG
ncbi:MAG: hypothetical protein HC837_14715 [Chloroflexaceae bacterium]|nr:hypothetical protein [Chloroflexaceae bacterium]